MKRMIKNLKLVSWPKIITLYVVMFLGGYGMAQWDGAIVFLFLATLYFLGGLIIHR